MHFLACTALAACCLGQTSAADNYDFRRGLDGWQGDGFYLTHGGPAGPTARVGVCSSDGGCPKRKAKITYRFTVPARAEALSARAFLKLAADAEPDHRLDVVLVLPDAGNRLIPKSLRTSGGWTPTAGLLPRWKGQPREYRWELSAFCGQDVQVIIRDLDDRPGCYIYAGGFRLISGKADGPKGESLEELDFARHMQELELTHKLLVMSRYDSKRFTAISNAREELTREHLRHCELFYDLFLDHFYRRGFPVTVPAGRLMVAVFDTPEGFNAYFGEKLAPAVAGIYHTETNRLVIYDLGRTKAYQTAKAETLKAAARPGVPAARTRSVERWWHDAVYDANLGTAIHECAHQLSFNCGLLNRRGHAPAWLVEGLACYCEATDEGDRQVIGAPNRKRIGTLAKAKGNYLPLADLVKSDGFLDSPRVLLGYAQSWALFRMLMEQQPAGLRDHFARIYERRTPEYYVADFRASFGHDLTALERRYRAYMDDLVKRYPPQTTR